eukprot:TRINITY_DN16376_c0_g1_i4.p1 TRINITY_DN16376_c0_g1~~TRINITY_DN16376_c0_g1_i4.p1  ORF type:complete len:760 (-),score=145.62 TRINITY_DN16376_c0_g1_i4:106-2385(-)
MASDGRQSQNTGEETTFEERTANPRDRFRRLMEKDSRRYEMLVLGVEVCYLVIFVGYLVLSSQFEFQLPEHGYTIDFKKSSNRKRNGPPPPGPKGPKGPKGAGGRRLARDDYYATCMAHLWSEGAGRMNSEGDEDALLEMIGGAAQLMNYCDAELMGTSMIADFISVLKVNNFIPLLFVLVRAWRLVGCRGAHLEALRRRLCGSWVVQTGFHMVALSWYGAMAGLFNTMTLSGGMTAQKFQEALYIGPTVYVFLLATLCLTVLDYRQAVIASTTSYGCFVAPTLVLFASMVDKKRDWSALPLLMFDQSILLVAIIAVCFARRSSWQDRQADFNRSEQLMDGIIGEKVKRCQAEFTAEQLHSSRQRKEADGESSYLHGPNLPLHETRGDAEMAAAMWPTPPSTLSAPADMDRLSLLNNTGVPRCDCLPMSSKVHVNGSSAPKPASELQVGEEVLCYDHLCGSIKFVPAVDVGVVTGPCNWSHVTMADGTTVSITAEHPVRVVGQVPEEEDEAKGVWGLGGGRVTHAGDLRPGRDLLKILRLGAVPVQEMRVEMDTLPRVRINLLQSWRYSMFCSQKVGSEMTAVAVESSDCLEGRGSTDLKERNTFIDVDDRDLGAYTPRKPKSAPERLVQMPVSELKENDDPGSAGSETQTGGESDRKEGRGSVGSSDQETESISFQHAEGRCSPCLFQIRHFQNPEQYSVCTKADCQLRLCHFPHSEEYIQKFKTAKRKYERKNRLAYRKGVGAQEEAYDLQPTLEHL